MLKEAEVFSGFSVINKDETLVFYRDSLGLTVEVNDMGLYLRLVNDSKVFLYPKENHVPATFTILNFNVKDIDIAVDNLVEKGVIFEIYKGMHQDNKGIARGIAANMGPDIAWFKDPSGNILSVLHEKD